jgi:hypothetical protein
MKTLMARVLAVVAIFTVAQPVLACGWVRESTTYACVSCGWFQPNKDQYTGQEYNTCNNARRTVTTSYSCGSC